jgi:hypothetical protein
VRTAVGEGVGLHVHDSHHGRTRESFFDWRTLV